MCIKKVQSRGLAPVIEPSALTPHGPLDLETSSNPNNRRGHSNDWVKSGPQLPSLDLITPISPVKLTLRDYILVSTFAFINICSGAAYCVLSPFFPKEAEARGLSPSAYGILFSIQEWIAFVLCPIYGLLLPKLGFRITILTGIVVGASGIVFFGGLNWATSKTLFTTLCASIRAYGSVGLAAVSSTCYAAIPVYYPHHISQIFGLLEMCYGVGMIVGPLLGGFLYEMGGFDLPFFVCGALLFLTFPVLYCIFPRVARISKNEKSAGILKVMSHWRITLQILITLSLCTVFGFNQSMLEPHIRSFANLRSSTVGVIFLLSGLFYGIFTWIVGLFVPKFEDLNFISIIGNVAIIVGFSMAGPVYPLPFKPSITLIVLSQVFYGMGLACCLVSNFTQAMREKDRSNLRNDVSAGSLISSIFVSAYALGTAIGPIIGGYLVEHFDFPRACIAIVMLSSILIIVIVLTLLFHQRKTKEIDSNANRSQAEQSRY